MKATGAGSASPVVSKMTLSYGCPAAVDLRFNSDNADRMSLRREQHIHPFEMVTRSSLERSWLETAQRVKSCRHPLLQRQSFLHAAIQQFAGALACHGRITVVHVERMYGVFSAGIPIR